MSLNKAFTIEIDRLLSMSSARRRKSGQDHAEIWPRSAQGQALSPNSLRSLGLVSLNRSNTFTAGAWEELALAGGPQRLLTVCARGWLTRSVNIDWNDCRAGGGGGSFSPACAKACVTPAVSGAGIDAGGVGGVGIDAGGTGGGETDAVRIGRSPGTDFTGAVPIVTGVGNGGARDDGVLPCVSAPPLCATATSRAQSKSRVSFP